MKVTTFFMKVTTFRKRASQSYESDRYHMKSLKPVLYFRRAP